MAAASFESPFSLAMPNRLAGRDGQQQTPKIIAIGEVGKLSFGGTLEEAVHRAEHYVFFVGGSTRCAAKFLSCKPKQLLKITFPQALRGGLIARFQLRDPVANGFVRVHSFAAKMNSGNAWSALQAQLQV